jgi:hypothetical protein
VNTFCTGPVRDDEIWLKSKGERHLRTLAY